MKKAAEPGRARTVRIRAYRGGVRDASRVFRVAADADLAAAMKRAALAAVPKSEGWHLVVLYVERTSEAEPVARVLDRLARGGTGGRDFAAALAVTMDGARAVLAVGARDPARIARLRAALSGQRG